MGAAGVAEGGKNSLNLARVIARLDERRTGIQSLYGNIMETLLSNPIWACI
jgi:hypothetical protein